MPEARPLWLHEAKVRPEWVDYNGHMNEAYYVLIFGDATDAFLDHIGLNNAARRRDQVSVYTAESHIRYLVETPEGTSVLVSTRILAHDEKRVRLHHTMRRAYDGQTLAVIEMMMLHVDKRVVRASPFAPEVAARIGAVAAAQAGLPPPVAAMSNHWVQRKSGKKNVLF